MTGPGKNIVLCLDGTGNQFREHNTNVVRLYRVLARDPERQIAFYDPGVGTLAGPGFVTSIGKRLDKLLGLGFGRGLSRNVLEAVAFVMRRYRPGDRLFLFGFSRGAYTARAVAGLLYRCGLLDDGAEPLAPYAWKLYKNAEFAIASRFRKTYARRCPIHFLGLWDTVSTIGWIHDPKTLPNTASNPSVGAVRHAVAIDERRAFFRQNLWSARRRERQDVKEVWFAGAHGDVGGGYPEAESGLAKIALRWMIDEARAFGLEIDEPTLRRTVLGEDRRYTAPDPTAAVHRSLAAWWWPVELLPRRVWDRERRRRVWRPLPRPDRPRVIPAGATVHVSVLERMRQTTYRPPNLPPEDELRARFGVDGVSEDAGSR